MPLTHFDAAGHAHMVDVSDKDVTDRVAVAAAYVKMQPKPLISFQKAAPKREMLPGLRGWPGSWGPSAPVT